MRYRRLFQESERVRIIDFYKLGFSKVLGGLSFELELGELTLTIVVYGGVPYRYGIVAKYDQSVKAGSFETLDELKKIIQEAKLMMED